MIRITTWLFGDARRGRRALLAAAMLIVPTAACIVAASHSLERVRTQAGQRLSITAAGIASHLNAVLVGQHAVMLDINARLYGRPPAVLAADFLTHQQLVELDAANSSIEQIDVASDTGIVLASSVSLVPPETALEVTPSVVEGTTIVNLSLTADRPMITMLRRRDGPGSRADGILRIISSMDALSGEWRRLAAGMSGSVILVQGAVTVRATGSGSGAVLLDGLRGSLADTPGGHAALRRLHGADGAMAMAADVGDWGITAVALLPQRELYAAWIAQNIVIFLGWLISMAVTILAIRAFWLSDVEHERARGELSENFARLTAYLTTQADGGWVEAGGGLTRDVLHAIHVRAVREWHVALRLCLRQLTAARRGGEEAVNALGQITAILEEQASRTLPLAGAEDQLSQQRAVSVVDLLVDLKPLYRDLLGLPVVTLNEEGAPTIMAAPGLLGLGLYCVLLHSVEHNPGQDSIRLALNRSDEDAWVEINHRAHAARNGVPRLMVTSIDDGNGLGMRAASRLIQAAGGQLSVEVEPGGHVITRMRFPTYASRRQSMETPASRH